MTVVDRQAAANVDGPQLCGAHASPYVSNEALDLKQKRHQHGTDPVAEKAQPRLLIVPLDPIRILGQRNRRQAKQFEESLKEAESAQSMPC